MKNGWKKQENESGSMKKKFKEKEREEKMLKWFLSSRHNVTNTLKHTQTCIHNTFYLVAWRKDKSVLKYEHKHTTNQIKKKLSEMLNGAFLYWLCVCNKAAILPLLFFLPHFASFAHTHFLAFRWKKSYISLWNCKAIYRCVAVYVLWAIKHNDCFNDDCTFILFSLFSLLF